MQKYFSLFVRGPDGENGNRLTGYVSVEEEAVPQNYK